MLFQAAAFVYPDILSWCSYTELMCIAVDQNIDPSNWTKRHFQAMCGARGG